MDRQLTKPEPIASCHVPPAVPVEPKLGMDTALVADRHKLMTDLLVLAVACDQTRVFNMAYSVSQASTTKAGYEKPHHTTTHEEAVDDALGLPATASWFLRRSMESWAYFVEAFSKVKEGDGTLLDNTFIYGSTDHAWARIHSLDGIPSFTAGRAGGRIKSGLHIDGGGHPGHPTGLHRHENHGRGCECMGHGKQQTGLRTRRDSRLGVPIIKARQSKRALGATTGKRRPGTRITATGSTPDNAEGGRSCGVAVFELLCAVFAPALFAPLIAACSPSLVRPAGEDFVSPERPVGIQIEPTELEGPVFADASGRTLYRWPQKNLRKRERGRSHGYVILYERQDDGERRVNEPLSCGAGVAGSGDSTRVYSGLAPGNRGCRAKPVGRWTIIQRKDGTTAVGLRRCSAVYLAARSNSLATSSGARARYSGGDGPAAREPVGPAPDVPPGFGVKTTSAGRLLVTERQYSVYVSDRDAPDASACDAACAKVWIPMAAPAAGRPHGAWTTFLRSDGTWQWAFRHKALYRYALDRRGYSLRAATSPGWHNVYTQRAPDPPEDFTVAGHHSRAGSRRCARNDDLPVSLWRRRGGSIELRPPDHDAGLSDRILRWRRYCSLPAVISLCAGAANAPTKSRSWRAVDIDPQTGRFARPGQSGAVHVWAYRDRPIYTFSGDRQPGDVNGDSHGEFRGERNGFNAFWIRDDYFGRTG